MPELRITWKRLGGHLYRRSWMYLLLAVVLFAATDMLFLATEPQTADENMVKFYVIDLSTNDEAFSHLAEDLLRTVSVQDETVEEVSFECFTFSNVDEADGNQIMALLGRLALGDGDVILTNPGGYEYLLRTGAYRPLDEFLEEGWLFGYQFEREFIQTEDGDTVTAAITIDSLDGLQDRNCMYNKGCYLMITAATTNLDSTLATVSELFQMTEVAP